MGQSVPRWNLSVWTKFRRTLSEHPSAHVLYLCTPPLPQLNQLHCASNKVSKSPVTTQFHFFQFHFVGTVATAPSGQKNFTSGQMASQNEHKNIARNFIFWDYFLFSFGRYSLYYELCSKINIYQNRDEWSLTINHWNIEYSE